ncbi:MAG: hypothetical protein F4029_02235 [Gammaproteobacteria bacterium]|nr:hypothetical protein [Gammaproteobacteria bacterium]MYF28407.1 hypothetical protein [Gammaproteobacteria bacterium]MYK45027.1 hypothetical protein [Gammaproteobacteria bacterium]
MALGCETEPATGPGRLADVNVIAVATDGLPRSLRLIAGCAEQKWVVGVPLAARLDYSGFIWPRARIDTLPALS